jgi:hypothetical protein
MSNPNPNLWAVTFSDGNGNRFDNLLVLAANAGVAERKARRFITKKLKLRGMRITEIEHSGTIDAF